MYFFSTNFNFTIIKQIVSHFIMSLHKFKNKCFLRKTYKQTWTLLRPLSITCLIEPVNMLMDSFT